MKDIHLILVLTLILYQSQAGSFYVSATANKTGTGSFVNPWQLQSALNHPPELKPGDTVWLREGTYLNSYDAQTSFSCKTNGTAKAAIIFRNYKEEKAIIDGQLLYSLYTALGSCSYTWFWGIEVTNSFSTDRNHDITGGITCTAENMKFINMIVHDTGGGIDCWKTATNSEVYGCLIYHIGNNNNNNGNLEGHGHGMYLQNDTFGTKLIHNNIIFSTYGYGMKVWQTTTTAALGNFDIQGNIVFNGGAASENLGGVGNNYRTHNFFVVSNSSANPIRNTVIKHNFTFSGNNTPRPPVNAFGLNYGVDNFILDSNYLTCQTRLGFNNTPIFKSSVKGNRILGGIPAVYGVYLWGFLQTDFPQNTFEDNLPINGVDYFLLPNKYDKNISHLVIYNWAGTDEVEINLSRLNLLPGDEYEIIQVMNYHAIPIKRTKSNSDLVRISMNVTEFEKATGSNQVVASQFPKFGVFILRKTGNNISTFTKETNKEIIVDIRPNLISDYFKINIHTANHESYHFLLYTMEGKQVLNIQLNESPLIVNRNELNAGIYKYVIQNKLGLSEASGQLIFK
ncbi:MAG: hypothetical protein ABI851_01275 [Saprospiraceae bacterium]